MDNTRHDPDVLAEYEGRDHEAGTGLIFVNTARDGDGPAMHQHPYSETFILQTGQALFSIGDTTLTRQRPLHHRIALVPGYERPEEARWCLGSA